MQTHQQFIRVLKGYGFSVSVKNNKIVLKNAIPFQENIPEEHYANNFPYEKIVLCGKGYVSTEAISLLCEKNCSLVLMSTYGEPIAFVNPVRESFQGSRYRMAQYDTFRIPEKREHLAKQQFREGAYEESIITFDQIIITLNIISDVLDTDDLQQILELSEIGKMVCKQKGTFSIRADGILPFTISVPANSSAFFHTFDVIIQSISSDESNNN